MDAKQMCESAIEPLFTIKLGSAADLPLIMEIERRPGYAALVGCYEANEHIRRMAAPTCTYLLGCTVDEVVGFAVIRRDDDGMGTAQLHRIAVWPPESGFGSAFMRAVCRWIFAEHDVDRLWLDVLASNTRAEGVYQKFGFVREGVMRSSLRVTGGRQDLVLMALLREDWENRRLDFDRL